jgi:hypothetical protein
MLLRHWFTTEVDHESGGIWPVLDSGADQQRREHRYTAPCCRTHAQHARTAETNGWEMTWLANEGVSGAVPPESCKRFKAALALLELGEAEALIFTNVDRASWCTEDFARLIRLSEVDARRRGGPLRQDARQGLAYASAVKSHLGAG